MRYEPIDDISIAEARAAIARDDPEELAYVPIALGLYAEDLEAAQTLCVGLADHADPAVRGNALLGFGHLARRFRRLDRDRVAPLVKRGLSDPDHFARGQAHAAADDLLHFLGWKL